jgi:hypothetical protein
VLKHSNTAVCVCRATTAICPSDITHIELLTNNFVFLDQVFLIIQICLYALSIICLGFMLNYRLNAYNKKCLGFLFQPD